VLPGDGALIRGAIAAPTESNEVPTTLESDFYASDLTQALAVEIQDPYDIRSRANEMMRDQARLANPGHALPGNTGGKLLAPG
jgi:hypothetical protein